MAKANGEGLNWSSVKTLLTSSYPSFNKNEIITDLTNLIIERETFILNHDDGHEAFYSLFVALATNALCSVSGSLSSSTLPQMSSACKVLLKFLLNRLETQNRACAVTPKYMMILINSLCQGSGQCLGKSDVVTFTCLFKPTEIPVDPEIKDQDMANKDKTKANRLSRLDRQKDLFDQMTSVFSQTPSIDNKVLPRADLGIDDSFDIQPKTPSSTTGSSSQDNVEESSILFTKKNAEMLLGMKGAEILLRACSQLTFLSKYMERYRDAVSGSTFLLPATLSQALTLRNGYQFLLAEVSDVWQAFSLPIIEPLTPDRLRTIVEVAMGCLFAAVSVATADTVVNVVKPSTGPAQTTGTKDEELDNQGHCIVQKSLEIFSWVASAVKISTRAGGNVAQNFNLFAAWVIMNGLQGILALTPAVILERKDSSKAKTSEVVTKREGQAGAAAAPAPPRPQSAKGNQPFLSVTAVALANKALQLTTQLLEDLSVETGLENLSHSPQVKSSEGLKLDIMDSLTAGTRFWALFGSVSFHDLLFNLMSVSFKKAVYLTRLKQGSDSQETTSSSSTSDSNTYFEDDFSTSEENSEADDDDEPILGHWLEEAMSPSDHSSSPPSVSLQVRSERGRAENKKQREANPGEGSAPFVPDKWEPEGFTVLVKALLSFFNSHLLNSCNETIKTVARSGISKEHVSVVAQLTKELDKECVRSDSVDKGYNSLSQELARFNHILVASGCLTEQLEDFFLATLGVSPTESDQWPLTAHTRTLAVLVSILLRRQQLERCNETSMVETVHNTLMAVWTKFLNRLHEAITWFENKTEVIEDVNIEHLQVLLLLFHSLRLAQKKEILVSLCNIIIQVSKMEPSRMQKTVPLPLSRLVLLMEYMMHNFYDPPLQLTEQVQHNLFTSQTGATAEKESHAKVIKYFACREVEENFRKGFTDTSMSEVASMRPRFYNLCPADPSAMDVSKVDGLAISRILSPESKLDYNQFYSSCINLLMAGSLCDKTKEKFSHLDACSMHYHFLLLWRLLSCLPPSPDYLHLLKEMNSMEKAHILHTLRWAPRLGQELYCAWVAGCLSKQGMNYDAAVELVTSASLSNTCRYDVILAMHYIKEQISKLPVTYSSQLSPKELPGMSDILILDAVVSKCQVSLDQLFMRSMTDPEPRKGMKFAGELIPAVFTLIEAYSAFARSCVLNKVCSPEDKSMTTHRLRAFSQVLSVGSSHPSAVKGLGSGVVSLLPSTVRSAIDKWNGSGGNEFPGMGSWRSSFASDLIPSESYMDAIHSAHMVTLSGQPSFCINASLRHVLQSLVKFSIDLVMWCPNVASNTTLNQVIFPLTYDVTTEYLGEMVSVLKTKVLGLVEETEAHSDEKAYKHSIQACYQIIVQFSDAESGLDEKILYECIKFMETCLEKPVARKAFKSVYSESAEMTSLLLTVARNNLSDNYTTHILRLFNKLFQQVEREPADENLNALCQGLTELASVEKGELQKLLIKTIRGSENVIDDAVVRTNNSLLQSLVKHIVREKSPLGEQGVCSILQALSPMGAVLLTSSTQSDAHSFPDLMKVLIILAGMGTGYGHVLLFEAAINWLKICMSRTSSNKGDQDESDETSAKPSHEILTCLLSYVGEIMGALKKGADSIRPYSPVLEVEPIATHDGEGEWFEELGQEEDDSGGEDSDEEALNNKLCTFTITQKEFMNQHWYHCHTCKMVDGVGVCSICAKVCHKDHDLTYAKFGSFFCDCGARQDGSCKALVKRTGQAGSDMAISSQSQSPFASDNLHHPHSALRQRLSSSPEFDSHTVIAEGSSYLEHISKARENLAKQLECHRDKLLGFVASTETVGGVLSILDSLMPSLKESYQEVSPKGSSFRAHQALRDLHTKPKEVETTTDQLMTVTLGSQEGAFENVRMNYSGDQGQTIRQLLTAHMLRRVAMCVMSSPHGKRQHLAVSHEKGKMTILQLSALLKQADSSKKKLTLTRLSSAPVPFTVLSISGNPCNEDYLAVCGLKDCHVMTFTSSGTVADHLVLHPSLSSGNFIIKAVWLPGSQTELAIVTADFVKIYDLGLDALSPQFYFLLPTGKIRDVTFVCNEESQAMVLMASSGYIYTQTLEDSSSARHGPFYITNVLEIKHSDLKDVNGQVAGGGVSVYYSHALQLLFFSYSQGKSFTAPVARDLSAVTNLFPISFKSSNGGSSSASGNSGNSGVSGGGGSAVQGGGGGKNSGAQPLVSWSEVPGHTGLMYCMAQATNNPIILMIKPDKITLQEIKVMPSKAKIQDVVAIRHPASNSDQHRTTMILLCEDGSLRIYMANVDATNFWMSPFLQPQSPISVLKPTRKKKSAKAGRPSSSVMFPVDFFEHCQHSNDVEFGGNDLLEVYNVQQLKSRLNTTGQYIASTKPTGFTLEVTNTNSSALIAGVRVLVGSLSVERAPSSVEVFGRTNPVKPSSRARWFDIPFTREESINADKKLFITFGCSADPASITMIDSIKVYVKTKELLGWPEEPEEFQDQLLSSAAKMNNTTSSTVSTSDAESALAAPLPITLSDRLVCSALEVLDGVFASLPESDESIRRSNALSLSTVLLNLNSPDLVQLHTRSLLASLFPLKSAYHGHKDQAQLKHVMSCLAMPEGAELDVEAFQRLLVTARSICVSRPMNLVRFAQSQDPSQQTLEVTDLEEECIESKEPLKSLPPLAYNLTETEKANFISRLVEAFWKLHASKPANSMLAPVCLPGLTNIEVTVCALVEVIHAFTMCDPDCVQLATKHYMRLLLSKDLVVSFACRQALIRVLRPRQRRRKVYIPSPPHCTMQGSSESQYDENSSEKEFKPSTLSLPVFMPPVSADQDNQPEQDQADVLYDVGENNLLLGEDGAHGNDIQELDGLWRIVDSYPPMVEIPPDADDETMVELAIALSLQEQGNGQGQLPGGLQQQLVNNLSINIGQAADSRLGLQNLGQGQQVGQDDDEVEMVDALELERLEHATSQAPGGISLQDLGLAPVASQDDDLDIEERPLSDTTASAPASDDEIGSTAATDGSTLRTSPAEHGGGSGGGSESGGSAVDSISATSGRSSTYGYHALEGMPAGQREEQAGFEASSAFFTSGTETFESDTGAAQRLHDLRRRFLEAMLVYFPEVQKVGGVRAIPFMQVLLMLTSDLDSEEEKDKAVLDLFLTTILRELDLSGKDLADIVQRSELFEAKLILLRLLSVLLSRSKSGSKHHSESTFVSNSTASALLSSGAIPYCLKVLQSVLPFWKNYSNTEDEKANVPGQLLKPHPAHTPPDMSPFFLRQYVKNHAADIFEEYPQLLTEMVLRLPYQLKKIADDQKLPNGVFDKKWHDILSEYMLTQQSPFVKRQVRKLLLFLCGSKDKYRQLRDDHTVQSHLHQLQELCAKWGMEVALLDMPAHSIILPYDTLLTMIEHLKAVCDIAMARPYNWQLYCKLKSDTLPYLIQASILLDEGVAPTLLQLLQYAVCGVKPSSPHGHGHAGSGSSSTSPVKHRSKRDREKSSAKAEEPEESRPFDESLCQELVKQLNTTLSSSLLIKFVRTYLLDSNSSGNRWMAHALVLQIYRNSSNSEQQALLESLWGLWQELPIFGRKAAQFVDLLGYFVLKTPGLDEKKIQEYLQKTVSLLKRENHVLSHHPNATIYNMLQGLVDFDGYYLESDPCLVCNNPEVAFQTLKLSAVKVDSKFTTTTQIVKLVGSHTISKISLRISDLKRTKMVQTLNIYYNNRSVQAVVELKNRPGLWHKARKVKLTSGQTEVKVEFPIPIVACNLMIEYADFYDNLQATAETLQCPRCSASVPATPGVCGNCGENVYQCHKCRSINYDEKDPFLCNSCGFCKYAKFDYTLMGKPCCAVDPIENEEDRKKAITSINNLLDKADRIYKQLQTHRRDLESLLIQVTEHGSERTPSGVLKDVGGTVGAVAVSSVNKAIQLLAQKYCGECKASFDELSKLIQKVMACRRELVEYDQQQRAVVAARGQGATPATAVGSKFASVESRNEKAVQSKGKKDCLRSGKCYGCASAAVEHCIMLLRALVTNTTMRQMLCDEGMVHQLIDFNLRHGALSVRAEVRNLLCLLTRNNRKGTEEMNCLIMARITAAVKGHQSNPDLGSSVRHEIMLLATSLLQDDSCWEQRTRCVMRLFLMGMQMQSPVIMESITLPCLRILQGLIKTDSLVSFFNGNKECGNKNPDSQPATFHMDIKKWLSGDSSYSYQNWKKRLPKPAPSPGTDINAVEKKPSANQQQTSASKSAVEIREGYLMEKYAVRWKRSMWKVPSVALKLTQTTWLQPAIFSPSSRSARQTACSVVNVISQVFSRRKEVIDMLTSCLPDIGRSGECATEFLDLYRSLIVQDRWKFYLAIKGVMLTLGRLITQEVEHLQYLEETTLSSDLAQGFALKALTELLALFVEQEQLKQHYKNRLVGCVLNCYLSLRKLVVQRTKLIDDTQEGLLQMLEELTTGTTSETKEFMAVCVQTVKNYPLDDYRSPIFIFERLCSIIYPEENDVTEFFLILEKDPQQEDFLQGRMLGNPYSCLEQGLGPLMRDIKNKICTDCELVALLEDDTGMELLVNKKIISLDLPVKDVYKKIWLPEHGEVEPMPVVYRMRGLLGDATEDMVNSLDSGTEENEDKEEVYKMASVLSDCGGLQVMLERLASIKDLVLGKQPMVVLLKLFSYAVHVKVNRQRLTNPDLGCINIMLAALNLALWSEQEGVCSNKGQTVTEQVLHIMEVVLLEASQQAPEVYTEFSKKCGDKEQLLVMLDRINSPIVRLNPGVLEGLMRLVPFLAFGEEDKMEALLSHFKPYLNFDKFDEDHSQDEEVHLNCFCSIASGIESNANGIRLKDLILRHGMVQTAINYILNHAPEIKTMLATDSEVWKGFLSKPSLSFALRMLTGLCTKHVPTQNLIAEKCIPILHKLEQVSSDQHLGTLAENLLDALKTNPEAAKKIEEVRQQTKAEKKRLAMAVRKKQLGALGMTTNERGQVTVKSSVLKQMEDLKEETGLTCCICREGYRYQPQKVLAVYTYSRRCNMDDYESKTRKTLGYCTVTHFNVIHVDCHTAAVRHARGREEWESAALQNANTRCNGLLPIWGPQVQESVFASCLARHNNYLQDCTGIRDLNYTFNVHDLKLLFMRFATERSFSEESGGGGPQSNLYFVPFVMHMVLYAVNTTRASGREEKNLTAFLDAPVSKWVENSGEVENVLYVVILAMHLLPPAKWRECQVKFLKRILVTAHVRALCPLDSHQNMPVLKSKSVQPYESYKSLLVFFGMVCAMYTKVFAKVKLTEGGQWTKALFEHIRHNDKTILEHCDSALRVYQEDLLTCEMFTDFVDIVGMLEEVPDPDKFLTDTLASLP